MDLPFGAPVDHRRRFRASSPSGKRGGSGQIEEGRWCNNPWPSSFAPKAAILFGMRFFAHINPKSAIHKQWRAGNRISGLLDGALFRWNPVKRVFEAAELPDEAIEKFRVRQDRAVILETL